MVTLIVPTDEADSVIPDLATTVKGQNGCQVGNVAMTETPQIKCSHRLQQAHPV